MTMTLEPVLDGRTREVEVTVRRTTLRRWQRAYPNLHFTVTATRNSDAVRVAVMLMPDDLAPATDRCYRTEATSYKAGNARNKRWWGIEVRGETGEFCWLENFEGKQMAEEAARTWFMMQGVDPGTVRVCD